MVWDKDLNTPKDQREYWDNVTQSYQFQLLWRQPLEPGKKYVLEVYYENPAGTRLTSDYVFDFAPNLERLKQELKGQTRVGDCRGAVCDGSVRTTATTAATEATTPADAWGLLGYSKHKQPAVSLDTAGCSISCAPSVRRAADLSRASRSLPSGTRLRRRRS